jgi:hypothetical protein
MRAWLQKVWQEADIFIGAAFFLIAIAVLFWLIGLPLLRG